MVSHDDRPLPGGAGNVEHLLLSDGLSAVSVFSTVQSREEKVLSGVSHMGPVQAYGRVVGSFHVTIVGEVPGSAIRMIGDNLRVPLPGPANSGVVAPPRVDATPSQSISAPGGPQPIIPPDLVPGVSPH